MTGSSSPRAAQSIGAALIFANFFIIGAVFGGVAWLFPPGAIHDWLLAACDLSLGASVALPLLTVLGSWVATLPKYLDCTHCRQATPETELQHMGGDEWFCKSCVAPMSSAREVA